MSKRKRDAWHCWSTDCFFVSSFRTLTTLFEKSNLCPKIQFWQNPNIFTSFLPKIFLTIFLVKSKLSTAKKSQATTFSRVFHPKKNRQFFSWNQSCQQLKNPKPQHFHEFFTPKKSTFFSGNQSWIFGQKMKISNSVLGNHCVWKSPKKSTILSGNQSWIFWPKMKKQF